MAARRKRLGLSLRDAGAEIGISFNTLSRVERGHLPDLENVGRLAAWLGESESVETTASGSTPELIAAHLRTDPLLSTETADKITAIVRDLYDALARAPEAAPLHLRAARTFTPEAAAELAKVLGRMRARLNAGH